MGTMFFFHDLNHQKYGRQASRDRSFFKQITLDDDNGSKKKKTHESHPISSSKINGPPTRRDASDCGPDLDPDSFLWCVSVVRDTQTKEERKVFDTLGRLTLDIQF